MSDDPAPPPPAPRRAIGEAIQNLTAARLGRGFVPLGVLAVAGGVHILFPGTGIRVGAGLLVGAVASAMVMLGYGLRVVQRSFGREPRPWWGLAMASSPLPPLFGLWVLGWLGLRELSVGGLGALTAILFAVIGVWLLRAWLRVVEIDRLARVMTFDLDEL